MPIKHNSKSALDHLALSFLWKWNAICKVCKKYSLNYKRVDGSFKQKEIENICWFCTSNSFFFLLMFLNELKDIHSGDMLIAVCTLKPRGYLCL